MRQVKLWALQGLFAFTGVLTSWDRYDASDRLCEWIDRHRVAQGFTAEQIAGWSNSWNLGEAHRGTWGLVGASAVLKCLITYTDDMQSAGRPECGEPPKDSRRRTTIPKPTLSRC